MRPVDKGPSPAKFQNYQDALEPLETRLGRYCSYCERRIENNLAVEHVRPKSLEPDLENEWDNFLLACGNCNSSKGNALINLPDNLWPDTDNTFLAFDYGAVGLVSVSDFASSGSFRERAEALRVLVGLDKVPQNPDTSRRPTTKDHRWLRRLQVWAVADDNRHRYEQPGDAPEVIDIIEKARYSGHFSIWMAVFADHPDVQSALIREFPGTRLDCFQSSVEETSS